jgi:hypothetical protein
MAKELSGVVWVSRFPTSRSTDALANDFRPKCKAFLAALQDAGASVTINATRRPAERAYLMHFSFAISTHQKDPQHVPPHEGVEIEWVHRKADGSPDLDASRAAAAAMVEKYDIAVMPALTSLHIRGQAIDMNIEWNGTLNIKQKNGATKAIASQPRSGLNHDLWAVGATYGVHKLPSDPPHWSSTGH